MEDGIVAFAAKATKRNNLVVNIRNKQLTTLEVIFPYRGWTNRYWNGEDLTDQQQT